MTERQIKTYLNRIEFNDPNRDFFIRTLVPSLKGINTSLSSLTSSSTQRVTCSPTKYSCPICVDNNNKITTFSTYFTYVRHLTEKHSSLFPCNGRIFSSNFDSKSHVVDLISTSSKSTTSNDFNQNHYTTNNTTNTNSQKPKLFKCIDCDQMFSRNEHLKKHYLSQKHNLNVNKNNNSQCVLFSQNLDSCYDVGEIHDHYDDDDDDYSDDDHDDDDALALRITSNSGNCSNNSDLSSRSISHTSSSSCFKSFSNKSNSSQVSIARSTSLNCLSASNSKDKIRSCSSHLSSKSSSCDCDINSLNSCTCPCTSSSCDDVDDDDDDVDSSSESTKTTPSTKCSTISATCDSRSTNERKRNLDSSNEYECCVGEIDKLENDDDYDHVDQDDIDFLLAKHLDDYERTCKRTKLQQ